MLTVNQVAEKLNVSRNTVISLIKKGEIKAIRVADLYRIPEEQFDQFISASEVTPNITQSIPLPSENQQMKDAFELGSNQSTTQGGFYDPVKK